MSSISGCGIAKAIHYSKESQIQICSDYTGANFHGAVEFCVTSVGIKFILKDHTYNLFAYLTCNLHESFEVRKEDGTVVKKFTPLCMFHIKKELNEEYVYISPNQAFFLCKSHISKIQFQMWNVEDDSEMNVGEVFVHFVYRKLA